MNILQNVVSAMTSALVTIILGVIIKRPLERRAEQAEERGEDERTRQLVLMTGVQAMLRDRLLLAYRHYEEKGCADHEDRSNVENMYSAYHNLGKNGVMDDMHKKFKSLPEHL